VFDIGKPIDPGILFAFAPNGLIWVTGLASVKPNPSQIAAPVSSSNLLIISTGIGAAPENSL